MAPELSKGEKASLASDMYSLGVILYEIVTGRFPIEEKTSDPDKPSHFAAPSTLNEELDPKWDQSFCRVSLHPLRSVLPMREK